MTTLKELFGTLANFSTYAAGVDASFSLDDMQAAYATACKRIKGILTTPVFDILAVAPDASTLEEATAGPFLMAVANMTLCVQLAFDTVGRRKNGVEVYKYELEGMRRAYTENYYAAMDSLIAAIGEAADQTPLARAWHDSCYQRLLAACRVQTADDFDTVYPIDGSQLFFFRTLPLQREVLATRLAAYFDRADNLTTGKETVDAQLRLVLCKKVVATALRRFDILECPATIRNLFDDSTVSGQRKDERQQAESLADRLDAEADELLAAIDTLLSADAAIDVSSMSAYNDPTDNIIMLP